jgi:LacI family transcriptional regulator
MDIVAVASRAGVSTATVSRVLNAPDKVKVETADKVRRAIAELNYVPNTSARSLRSGKSNLFGIIVSDIRNPFFPDIIEHFESLATERGIDVTFANTGYSEERLQAGVKRLLERGIDGLAVLTSEVSAATVERIRESHIPVVFLNQPSIAGDFRNIAVDYVRSFCEAVEHVRALGHERIGFVAGPDTLSSAIRRKAAFLAAMKACRLTIREEWVLAGDHKIAGGQAAAERYFGMARRPSAVLCSNDMTAIGMLHTANRLGRRIPEEMSLVGFDDLALCEMVQPALTTLHLSRQEIAVRAFEALLAGTKSVTGLPSTIVPRLVVRASTGVAGKA